MVVADPAGLLRVEDARREAGADVGVLAHVLELGAGQRAGAREEHVRERGLAEVVQPGGLVKARLGRGLPAERLGQRDRERGDAGAVGGAGGVAATRAPWEGAEGAPPGGSAIAARASKPPARPRAIRPAVRADQPAPRRGRTPSTSTAPRRRAPAGARGCGRC